MARRFAHGAPLAGGGGRIRVSSPSRCERGSLEIRDDLLLDQRRVVEGEGGAQERALGLLAAARLVACHQSGLGAKGGQRPPAAIEGDEARGDYDAEAISKLRDRGVI